ncbi:hypothetical protein K438DRAFT_800307 [Mycena galopus ATCC 62051]|nr:hypothetical protein K438DRAFT_800307 [Mycena galopus ATCC 62051]
MASHPALAHPSMTPVPPPERLVRHAPRPSALPAARAGLLQLHDTTRCAQPLRSNYHLLRVPRAYDLILKVRPPRIPATPMVVPPSLRRLRYLLIRHHHLQPSPLDVPALHRARHVRRLPTRPAILSAMKTRPRYKLQHDAHVTYPCAATLRPTICSKPGPVAQCGYGAHHHQRTQHTPHHPRHFRPVPARAHNPPRRTALAARLACLHVLLQSCVRSVHRGHSPPPAPRAVPIASDHHADPFRCPTARRHLRVLYAARGQQRVTRLRRFVRCMRCASGERTSVWR